MHFQMKLMFSIDTTGQSNKCSRKWWLKGPKPETGGIQAVLLSALAVKSSFICQ